MIYFNVPHRSNYQPDILSSLCTGFKSLIGGGINTETAVNHLISLGYKNPILTTSCTDALEMAARLFSLSRNDEILVPAYTFVSSALPFANLGCKIRFVDVDSLCMNSTLENYKKYVTKFTKVIVVVNYAGSNQYIKEIRNYCLKNNIYMLEDAAQSIGSKINGELFGTFGDISTISLHDTKNINSMGEGGILLVNNQKFLQRAYNLLEKGTNRHDFQNGVVNKYGWVDYGSSHVMSDFNAAFFHENLKELDNVTQHRKNLFNTYVENLKDVGITFGPVFNKNVDTNGHLFYVMCNDSIERFSLISFLKSNNIECASHYLNLSKSKFILENYGKFDDFPVTDSAEDRLLRLPMHYSLCKSDVLFICSKIKEFYKC